MRKFKLQSSALMLALFSSQVMSLELDVYGLGHLSLDSVDDGTSSSMHVTSSSSRLGFKGEHLIRDNFKVIFQYETGLDLTAQGTNDGNGGADSSGQIFTKGRPSYLGLEGDLGTVLIGHMPALDQWANDYNLFADQVGDLGNLWEGSGVPGRLDNVIYYRTPSFSGLDIAVTYAPEEGKDDSDHLLFKANYKRNGFKLGLAHASIGQGVAMPEHTAQAITVSYDFGGFTIGGGFQSEMDIGGVDNLDRGTASIGASVDIGKNSVIKLQYADSSGEYLDSDANLFAVGYDYNYDESTKIYLAYAKMSNDNQVQFSANGKGHGDKVVPSLGQDPNAISLGIVYQFDVSLYSQK